MGHAIALRILNQLGRPTVARCRRAFTLVEVIVVVLIMGILLAVATPRMSTALQHHRLEAAAARIGADLELARKTAMTTSARVTVSFDTASESYLIPQIADFNHASQQYCTKLGIHPYSVNLVTATFGGPNDHEVQFNAFGLPDSRGTILIQSGSSSRTIVLFADSGKTSVQ